MFPLHITAIYWSRTPLATSKVAFDLISSHNIFKEFLVTVLFKLCFFPAKSKQD